MSNVRDIRPPPPPLTREEKETRVLLLEKTIAGARKHITALQQQIGEMKAEHKTLRLELAVFPPGTSPLRTCFPAHEDDL